ncbi:unnamed protein product [Urochloa decumbens]|uniref:Uncharacterized protein n=1 Tax=Urochloa decumbens TaxID=240449 RepID=A0ABC9F8V3_9POAL
MAATARALRLVASSSPAATHRSLLAAAHRRLLSASTESAGAGDPAVHSGDAPSDDYADRPPRFSGAEAATKEAHGGKHALPALGVKESVPPFAPSGNKLGSQEFTDQTGASSFTQKRRLSSGPGGASREEATPGGEESSARKVREEDREYYRTHKPSPLAELEFADTRKPITRATDASGGADDVPARVVEDTADDSLARAEAMFREAASRGNPEWPHSRALAEMLARRQQQGDGGAANGASWGS